MRIMSKLSAVVVGVVFLSGAAMAGDMMKDDMKSAEKMMEHGKMESSGAMMEEGKMMDAGKMMEGETEGGKMMHDTMMDESGMKESGAKEMMDKKM